MNQIITKWSFLITICSRLHLDEGTSEAPTSEYPGLPNGDDFMQKIIPNIWAFLVQFLAFMVLLLVIFLLAYKPVKKILRARQEHIETEIREAEQRNIDAEAYALEARSSVLEAKKEANIIIDNARQEAINQQNLIIEETNKEIAQMKLDAEADIAQSRIDAEEEIRKQIVSVALDASSHLLGREVNSEDNAKLINEFVENLGEDNN